MAPSPDVLVAHARVRRRVARYRALSALLKEDGQSGPLISVARDLEAELSRQMLQALDIWRRTQVLLAELDTFMMRARAVRLEARALASELRYSAEDVREEARLCAEEAAAAEETATKRAIAGRAFELAQLAEVMERQRRDGEAR